MTAFLFVWFDGGFWPTTKDVHNVNELSFNYIVHSATIHIAELAVLLFAIIISDILYLSYMRVMY